MARKKTAATSFRLSAESKRALEWAAQSQHITQAAVLELAIQAYVRELRKQLGQDDLSSDSVSRVTGA